MCIRDSLEGEDGRELLPGRAESDEDAYRELPAPDVGDRVLSLIHISEPTSPY